MTQRGTVTTFFIDRAFGYIKPDAGGEDVYVHWSKIRDEGFVYLAPGEQVQFESEMGDKGREVALWVEPTEDQLLGTVTEWDQMRGVGRIQPIGEPDSSLFFHFSDILSVGRATAVPGESVRFQLEESEKGRKAIRVKRLDPRPALKRFGRFPSDDDWTTALAALAEPEDWNRYGEPGDESIHPILSSYLLHTFSRLQEEESAGQTGKKIATAENDGTHFACFNTGLVTTLQEEIFAFFEANRVNRDVTPWYFLGFTPESDRRLDAAFGGNLPELARYFDNPSELIYDPDLELVVDAPHIVEDNLDRFPTPFRENTYMAQQALQGQVAGIQRRARRNYKTAVPQFHHGSIQLLLPLHLQRPDAADLALVVERTGQCYRGATVLPLQWAYRNARLLTRPDPDWLVPGDVAGD